MCGKRILPLFIAAVSFILPGQDCVSLLFAGQKAHHCCQNDRSTQRNLNPCCQVNTTAAQDQAKPKAQPVDFVDLAVLTHLVQPAPAGSVSPLGWMFAPSPPGQLGSFSLPLLV